MKFTCNQKEFNTHLSIVSRVVPSKPTHLVLANILIKVDAHTGLIELTGFDLNLGVKTAFKADVATGGEITLPGKLLIDIVSRLSDGDITIYQSESDKTNESVTLISKSGKVEIKGMSSGQYPEFPSLYNSKTFNLPAKALKKCISRTIFAASNEEIKMILTGVHLQSTSDGLEFAATDSHRLSVVNYSLENQDIENDFDVTIHTRALQELQKIINLSPDLETVILSFDDTQVQLSCNQQRIISRKVNGTYPNYKELIPKTYNRIVSVDRVRLIKSLELIAILANQKNYLIKFTVDAEKEELILSSDAQDLGNAKETMTAAITGTSTEIAFNVKYLINGLKMMTSPTISMKFNEPNQPAIFKELDQIEMIYLIMPVIFK